MKLRYALLLALAFVVGLAAGCGGGGSSSQSQAGSTSGNATSGSGGSSQTKTVKVAESEYKLTPSNVTLSRPGTYTFKVTNKGTITHALEIEGTGVNAESGDISAGQSKTFTVDLKGAGTYEMYCPIDGHRQQGMDGKVTIGSAGAGPAGTTSDTSTTETETHTDTTKNNGGGGGGGGY